jgi:hypothetical protein
MSHWPLVLVVGLAAASTGEREAEEEDTGLPSEGSRVRTTVQALQRYAFLRTEIEPFWRDPDNQAATTWLERRNINEVMLATSLAPEGCVVLRPRP